MAAAETGDFAAAHDHLRTIGQLGRRPFWIISDHFDWAAGRVALAEGNLDIAVERLEAAATAFRLTGALPYAGYVLADLAEAAGARRATGGRRTHHAGGRRDGPPTRS